MVLILYRDNGRCTPYHGPLRSNISCDTMFRVGVDYVYIPNTRERGNQVSVRDFLERPATLALQIIRTDHDCFVALSRALCVHYYLPCGSNGTIHVPQFLCPEVCDYIVNDVCRTEWPILLNEFQTRIAPGTTGLEFPFCNNTQQTISYLNLSNDCCNDAGIIVPSSTVQVASLTPSASTLASPKTFAAVIISSLIAGIVLIFLTGILVVFIVVLFQWRRKGKMIFSDSKER